MCNLVSHSIFCCSSSFVVVVHFAVGFVVVVVVVIVVVVVVSVGIVVDLLLYQCSFVFHDVQKKKKEK